MEETDKLIKIAKEVETIISGGIKRLNAINHNYNAILKQNEELKKDIAFLIKDSESLKAEHDKTIRNYNLALEERDYIIRKLENKIFEIKQNMRYYW